MSKIEVTLAPGSAGIRVVEQERVVPSLCKDGEGRVFVTIGAGETRVSILNADGARDASWTALFGWSFMFDIPVVVNGKEVRVDETELLQAALSGQARLFGTVCDTGAFAEVANLRMREALDQILSHTIGAGGPVHGHHYRSPRLAARPPFRAHSRCALMFCKRSAKSDLESWRYLR